MAYSEFAYLYDALNTAADYDRLCGVLTDELKSYGILDGIVADLGCGTGEVSLRLACAGYDMLSVDASEDMLTVFREKLPEKSSILLLQQPLEELDLYGTIRAAVCTFDTFNHLPPDTLQKALGKASLFTEPGGLLLFDANTPYKHQKVLANNLFQYQDEDFVVHWQNQYLPEIPGTRVTLCATEAGEEVFTESFVEYEYPLDFWQQILDAAGYDVRKVQDGERFAPLGPDSQRYLITAQKRA